MRSYFKQWMPLREIQTEGVFVWGLGRVQTSRRWIKKNNLEQPSFGDYLITQMDIVLFKKNTNFGFFPRLPLLDLNLRLRSKYTKSKD